MMITFKSVASGEVLMFSKDGKQMLRLLGKDPEAAMGVVTVAQLPAAIAVLKRAIEQDKGAREVPPVHGADADDDATPNVQLAQRTLPLIALLASYA